MKLRGCLIWVALPVGLGACDNKGSLGEYAEDTGGQETTATSGADDNGDGATSMSGGNEGGVTSEGPTTGADSEDSASAGVTTDGPTDCANGSCAIECGEDGCGPLDQFDAQGCQRPSCSDDADCGGSERCFVGDLFGVCVSSGSSCEYDDELMMCLCGGLTDCNGGYCVDAEAYPEGTAGPDGASRLQNGCAPNDGPAVDILIGLPDGTCASLFGPEPAMRFSIYDLEFGTTGTFEIGIQNTGTAGQGWYQNGDSGESVWLGTVTISEWGLDAGIAGSYEVWAGEQADGGFGHYVGTFSDAQFCDNEADCG